MTVDYEALSQENREEYGRAIGRIGKMLLEDRYDKRTHFIYEVLQNAEDALRRRPGWVGSRAVNFTPSGRATARGNPPIASQSVRTPIHPPPVAERSCSATPPHQMR